MYVLIVIYFVFRALHHCKQMIQRYSRGITSSSGSALPQSSHSNVGKAVEDCMRAVIGVLLNLTHDNGETQIDTSEHTAPFSDLLISFRFLLQYNQHNYLREKFNVLSPWVLSEWGSTKTGEQDGFLLTALDCVLKVPHYLLQEQRFDIRVLVRAHESIIVRTCAVT